MNTLLTTHPKNGQDVTIHFNNDLVITRATYSDGEDVDLTDTLKSHFNDTLSFLYK